jgi:ABC-type amino acid transport substrate-binding protein
MNSRLTSALLVMSLLLAAPHACASGNAPDTPAPPQPPQQHRLVVLVDAGSHMPLADIADGALTGGLHHDVGAALAERLGRTPQFKVWPRKRIGAALEQGEGDVLCLYMPEWLPGRLQWSVPFFPITEVVITRRDAPRPQALADLADQQIGTVLGYVYPELEHALGARFVRADTASGLNSLRKLELGRVRHAETTTLFVDYFLKQGGKLDIHPPLAVKTYRTLCAVSPRGSVALDDLNRAIGQLLHDGGLARILASYR